MRVLSKFELINKHDLLYFRSVTVVHTIMFNTDYQDHVVF